MPSVNPKSVAISKANTRGGGSQKAQTEVSKINAINFIQAAAGAVNKRTKERTIADIIEKVSLWRKLYNGVVRDGTLVRYSLEDAAVKVEVSKKSLDDYLLQLRFGKKYEFDFQQNKQEKVGVLRTYVKNKKGEEREKNKNETATAGKNNKMSSMLTKDKK